MESMQGVYPDRASGYTIGGHPGNISGQDAIVSSGQHSTRVVHIRIVGSAAKTPDCRHFPPGCSHFTLSVPPFHPGILHPAHDAGWERMRFNFSGQTYPNHLIAVYPDGRAVIFAQCHGVLLKLPDIFDRHLEIFCTVPRCSTEASRYVPPTF